MANSPSAIKRARTNIVRRDRNRAIKSQVRTLQRKFQAAVNEGRLEDAQAHYNGAASALDKAAGKGILHKNHAARRKSRMAAQLQKAE